MAENSVMRGIPKKEIPYDTPSGQDIQHVLDHGYVILEDVFSRAEGEEAIAEMQQISGATPKAGRNSFEGLSTNRIYSLLNKTRVFDKFAILPKVLALNDYFLDDGYQISSFHTIQINPGEKPQEPHYDDGYCQLRRPRGPMSTAIIIALDDFTEENGATRIIPGSHKWPSDRKGKADKTIPMCCPAGSVVYFLGTTWHGGGSNISSRPRRSATAQYCQPYIRPIENQILAVDPRRLPEIPERIVEMMGYRTHRPFIGYVDGMNPRRAAERMVKWLQQPLDSHPPPFPNVHGSKL